MELLEKLLRYDGFVYKINGRFYFLGKWICKEVCDLDITDCQMMFEMDMKSQDLSDAGLYFNKLRAYSDFALVPPCNPALTKEKMTALLSDLDEHTLQLLSELIELFEKGCETFAGKVFS